MPIHAEKCAICVTLQKYMKKVAISEICGNHIKLTRPVSSSRIQRYTEQLVNDHQLCPPNMNRLSAPIVTAEVNTKSIIGAAK